MYSTIQQYILLVLIMALSTGCTADDTGRLCESTATAIGSEPVVGESVTAEVAKLTRDAMCQSLQCLAESGLPAYCTRTCSLKEESTPAQACSTDSDCPSPAYCLNGSCQDDDCPAGFWCRSPFAMGALSESPLCVRRKGCSSNIDCEGLGRISCISLSCVDQCLLDPETCTEHSLLCQDRETLPCSCPEELGEECTDAELECTIPGSTTPLPTEAVLHRSVCIQDTPPT